MKLDFVITLSIVSRLLSFENSSAKSEDSTELAIQNENLKNISNNSSITYYIEKVKGLVVVWFWLRLQAINDSPFRVGRIGLANRLTRNQRNRSAVYTTISDIYRISVFPQTYKNSIVPIRIIYPDLG